MKKKANPKILLALFLIVIPNVNIVDLLPDFIGYIILYRAISGAALAVPYMHETKEALKKLIFVGLAKIPAFVIMVSNMHSGRDIVPLFTLVFCVIEAILLYTAVTSIFAGLFYVGGRTDSKAITSPIEFSGTKITSDGIKLLSITFLMTKCALNVIPEFCLLTTFNPKIIRLTNGLYGPLLILAFIGSLVFGIMWFTVVSRYVRRIRRECDLPGAIESMLGDEKLDKVKNDLFIKKLIKPVNLLTVSSIFTVDLVFANTNGINLLPHFIYGFILFLAGIYMSKTKTQRIWTSVLAVMYSGFGIAAYIFTVKFANKYRFIDMPNDEAARDFYINIEVFTLLETVAFLAFAVFLAYIMRKFIIENTGISPKRRSYNKVERDYHRMNIRHCFILFSLTILIHLAKCFKVFMDAKVNMLFSHTGIIVTSPIPWLSWATVGVSVILVFFSFIYLSDIKTDIRFKYEKEEIDTRKGVFE